MAICEIRAGVRPPERNTPDPMGPRRNEDLQRRNLPAKDAATDQYRFIPVEKSPLHPNAPDVPFEEVCDDIASAGIDRE